MMAGALTDAIAIAPGDVVRVTIAQLGLAVVAVRVMPMSAGLRSRRSVRVESSIALPPETTRARSAERGGSRSCAISKWSPCKCG